MENVNILSVVIAALIPTAMGMLWYSNILFQKPWMASIGMTEEKQKSGNMPVMFGVSLLMAVAVAFFFLNFNNAPGQEGEFDNFGHGMAHGVFLSLRVERLSCQRMFGSIGGITVSKINQLF